MDFLKKHARFLIVLVVLLVLLWFANSELADSSRRVDAARTKARSLLVQNYGALFKDAKLYNGEPAVVEGRKIQDSTQNLQQIEKGRNVMLAFETDPAFTVAPDAGDDDKVQTFRTKILELQRELAFKRYFVPDAREDGAFGFKADKTTGAQVPEFLRKLDIVRTVSLAVGRNNVARLNKLTFKPLDKDLDARRVPTVASAVGEEPYFATDGLEFEVQGTEQAIYNLMLDLQRPMKGDSRQRYLSVERFKLEKPDLLEPTDNLVTATLTIAAYRVNEASSYPVDKSAPEQPQGGSSRPRTFR
ncbi:MAG: hypothetical protein IPP14_07135 [Planctomycetes bacterium]|nr:hypothetical protein [Planctomycetota bacterium]